MIKGEDVDWFGVPSLACRTRLKVYAVKIRDGELWADMK